MNIRLALLVLTAFVSAPTVALAQAASPYAGEQAREIKALSAKEVADLLAGAGMGYARAAELNRYPGPMHALEHARELGLSEAQRGALASLMARHKDEARALGAEVVALERELDGLFATRTASAAKVDEVLARLGAAQARLRGAHLKTHLEATALLSEEQVARYVQVRGYGAGTGAGGHGHGHGGAHSHRH